VWATSLVSIIAFPYTFIVVAMSACRVIFPTDSPGWAEANTCFFNWVLALLDYLMLLRRRVAQLVRALP
jgi:hypothetical protein